MDKTFKQLIKEAILEALVEFTQGGVATLSGGDTMEDGVGAGQNSGDASGNTGQNSGNGNGNSGQGGGSADNSGGTPSGDGRPKPNVGIGVWSMRP